MVVETIFNDVFLHPREKRQGSAEMAVRMPAEALEDVNGGDKR
jgi:hypothetical protein